jgi:hypothetical protein
MKVLRRRENGRRPVKDGAASNRAQLGRTEDTRKDMKETGNKHFSEDFILNREESNGTQLDNRGNRGDLRKQPHNTTPEGHRKEARG